MGNVSQNKQGAACEIIAPCSTQGIAVQQGLRGMGMPAVAAVDHAALTRAQSIIAHAAEQSQFGEITVEEQIDRGIFVADGYTVAIGEHDARRITRGIEQVDRRRSINSVDSSLTVI